jgi:hypothetical protein
MNRSYFVVVILTLAFLVGLFACAGVPLAAFVDFPSLGVVLAPALLMGFAGHSPREIARSFRVAFTKQGASGVELGQAETYFDALVRYLACGGALGVVVGFVAMFLATAGVGIAAASVVRDKADAVGRGTALALVCLIYALVLIILVALPFRTAIRKRLAAA